jgi:RNA polymerase sigma-70 factor (ECF subfamily)
MYEAHHASMRAYALKLTRDSERAGELIQETFVRAHRYLKTFDGTSPVAWLKRIMLNIHIDEINERKKKHAIRGGALEYEDHLAHVEEERDLNNELYWHFLAVVKGEPIQHPKEGSTEYENWRALFNELVSEELLESLSELSEDHRNILIMSHLLDMQYDEISKIVERPIGTVMSRLSRARTRFADLVAAKNEQITEQLKQKAGQRRETKRGRSKKVPQEDHQSPEDT